MSRRFTSRNISRRRFLLATASGLTWFGGSSRWAARADDFSPATTRLNGWLESRFDVWLATSPMQQSYLGIKTNADKWDDLSEDHSEEDRRRAERDLADLHDNFADVALSAEGKLSYRLYDQESQKRIADHRWRHHAYPVNQMSGWQQQIPAFLINIHRVESAGDAEAYIARLNGIGGLVDQIVDLMKTGEAAGVLAPRFVYGHVIRDCRNVIAGAPFAGGRDSPLFADITAKIDALAADKGVKQKFKDDATRVLTEAVKPAFVKLIDAAQGQQERAGNDDGVWRLPQGEDYYAYRLKGATTTDMTAADIHAFGLTEVERIHGEMRAVMDQVSFKGTLTDFFTFLKTDPQFRYPNTPEGKAAYLARTNEIIAGMQARLGEIVLVVPQAKLVVRAVEPFREQSATSAFYQSASAADGRPGTYYVNTYDMSAMPKYAMEALVYHETIPGHHLQTSLVRAMDELPRFRRLSGSYIASMEGWAVYCERLAKEMGFYEDPYADFGRLSEELWRACRLVVDTGIHAADKRWSRETAVAYLKDNTPNAEADITNSVERYIVTPGQATAYTIGMAKILDLRAAAKAKLGDKFDLRAFHQTVLGHGALPLDLLAETVNAWMEETAKG